MIVKFIERIFAISRGLTRLGRRTVVRMEEGEQETDADQELIFLRWKI